MKSPQVSRTQVFRVFNKICKDVGLDKSIATHGFRRTRANYLLNHGMPITTLSKFLRHKNIGTTIKISTSDSKMCNHHLMR
ncbi:tyrosine-type recombinase/integrase [Methanococcoides seepicolus]|uniref:Tyrosine-type recombinase/integrase n=1 Tax=Methanococcoides seepicolus TaxID=2828780 RepID=A0A9E5D9Y9_9EURY|nr:tyrosine-type recombinase/integrase [Methanococcoides seepicolus]